MKLEPFKVDGRRWRFLQKHTALVSAFRQAHKHRRRMKSEPAKRQARTARSILSRLCSNRQRGVLLADDVGTGKTTIAAWVALIVAGSQFPDENRPGKVRSGKVRVLAPNENMARRWREELDTQAKVFRRCAKYLDFEHPRTADRNLVRGRVLVATHGSKRSLACDLLIVDEAHRAKGSETQFAEKLRRAKSVKRFLFLTATPFSISIRELTTILLRVGGEDAKERVKPVKKLARRFDMLFGKSPLTNTDSFVKEIKQNLEAAVKAIHPYVIRSTLSSRERSLYEHRETPTPGLEKGEEWPITVEPANDSQLEVLIRMDRLLSLAKKYGLWQKRQTNDPRYHVGWHKLRDDLKTVRKDKNHNDVRTHSRRLEQLLTPQQCGPHPKLTAVVETVRKTVAEGEKVLVFCDHHKTARELTVLLDQEFSDGRAEWPNHVNKKVWKVWRKAWHDALSIGAGDQSSDPDRDRLIDKYKSLFVDWLCSSGVAAQIAYWLEKANGKIGVGDTESLKALLKKTRARNAVKGASDSVLEEASRLMESLIRSRSSRAILRKQTLPGQSRGIRVVGYCEADDAERENSRKGLFFPGEPDALMMVFNSPFGPDVLVTTDRLSEGVDLHGFCRHLIHYEMDPSPLRLVQREGRLWRINSWAARCKKPVRIASPYFTGTRDEPLVRIVCIRRAAFSLVFGGTNRPVDEETDEMAVSQQNEILRLLRRNGVPKNPFAPS